MLSRFSLCLFLAAGAVLLRGPAPARAQDANRDVVETRRDIAEIVNSLASKSGDFKEAFDHAISHSMIDGTKIEVNARHRADDLHDAARHLADVFHDKRDKNNPAVRDQADKTIAAASEVNRVMLNHRFTDKLQRDWEVMRSDLNALAGVYDLSPIGGEAGSR